MREPASFDVVTMIFDMNLLECLEKASVHLTAEDAAAARTEVEEFQQAGIVSFGDLVDAVGDARTESRVRLHGCGLLALLGERSASPALERAFEEGADDGLAWEAARALARLRPEAAVATLVRVLELGTPTRQAAAAYALGWIGAAAAILPLRAVAVNPHLTVDVRGHAVEALGVMQAREAVPDLIATLSSESPALRYWAAYALGQIGDRASIPSLERVASSDDGVLPHGLSVKQEALDALGAINAEQNRRKPRSFIAQPRGHIYSSLLQAAVEQASTAYLIVRDSIELTAGGRECLQRLQPQLISERTVSEWPGTQLLGGSQARQLVYQSSASLAEVLQTCADGLYDWTQPSLPEDLGFLREDGSVWLGSTAHERDAWMELETSELNRLLAVCPEIADIIESPRADR